MLLLRKIHTTDWFCMDKVPLQIYKFDSSAASHSTWSTPKSYLEKGFIIKSTRDVCEAAHEKRTKTPTTLSR
jgi:hypothetical protein